MNDRAERRRQLRTQALRNRRAAPPGLLREMEWAIQSPEEEIQEHTRARSEAESWRRMTEPGEWRKSDFQVEGWTAVQIPEKK